MVALLTAQRLDVVLLLDDESDSKNEKDRMVKEKLIRDENVLFVTSAFDSAPPTEADIEDLLAPDTYDALVRESYKKELVGISLSLNSRIPRIVKRFEQAFEQSKLSFNKTRPANLFMRKMATDPASVLTTESANRFEQLFTRMNEKIEKLTKLDRKPFA